MQDFDVILQEIGEFGRYQQLVVCLLTISTAFLTAYCGFQLVFLTYTPSHLCKIPQNLLNNTKDLFNITAGQCEISYNVYYGNTTVLQSEKCQEWIYDKQYFDSTLITQWNLVCDRAIDSKISLRDYTQIRWALSFVFGAVLYAYLLDHCGRKVAFEINLGTYILGGSVSLFMPGIWSFTAVRLLASMNYISCFNIGYIWALEYTGPSKRVIVTTLMCSSLGIAMATLSLVAWLCSTWVQVGLVTTLPFLVFFSYHFVIMESPRWLLTQGRTDEAMEVIKRIARWQQNKTVEHEKLQVILSSLTETLKEPIETGETNLSLESRPETQKMLKLCSGQENLTLKAETRPIASSEHRKGLLDLFRKPQIRKKTILLTFAYIATAVAYVGISYNAENLGGNFLVTWVLLSFVEIIGCWLILVLNKVGRIIPLSTLTVLSGVCCLLTAPGEYFSPNLAVGCAVMGKLIISATYGMLYHVAGEMFPTVVRGLGIGFCSVAGDAGNIVMPYIVYSARAYKMLPMVTMGLMTVTAGFLVLFLPETKDQYMPESLEEAEDYGKVGCSTMKQNLARLCQRTRTSTHGRAEKP